MSIHDIPDKIKSRLGSKDAYDIAIVFVVILVGIVSFMLGRLSIGQNSASNVLVSLPNEVNSASVINAKDYDGNLQIDESKSNSANTVIEKGAFVASKNGTKYYPSNCSSVSRIKEENKVYFNTEQEAKNAGLSRTSTCK